MDSFAASPKCLPYNPSDPKNGQKDIYVQLVLSLALGASAFIGFCILRPKWKTLYSARKKQIDAAVILPELPDSFFGWIPILHRVTEEEVLASAGLDAFVFLSFFKMAMKLFSAMFLTTTVVLVPINGHFNKDPPVGNVTRSIMTLFGQEEANEYDWNPAASVEITKTRLPYTNYLWSYLVFTYIFTGLTIYFMRVQTLRIIKVRQEYLGSQNTITDRTIKLSGIPKDLRDEDALKETIEKLNIGKVESVTICRDWKKLDDMMDERAYVLRKLEEAWTVHLGRQEKGILLRPDRMLNRPQNGDESGSQSMESDAVYKQPRPTTRIWHGIMKLQSKKVDAIDHFQQKLRNLDDKIIAARQKKYKPTALAFVTMESIQRCQAFVQMVIDGTAGQLLAQQAPAPSDVVWQNTYLSRSNRMFRSWTITGFILFLSVFWLIPVLLLTGLTDLCSIRQLWPGLANVLESHRIVKALVQTGLPTLIFSLLNVAVPFLYDYLANKQGMISQGDVELSTISKNFLFTFFNLFLVFTIGGSANAFWPTLYEGSKDPAELSRNLARAVKGLGTFYTNFIILQAFGLLPFRLLQFGSVSLYPIMRMGSKTPRDFAELVQPPTFQYGFFLPSAILIFILCLVYSILPAGYMILFFGLVYFVVGYYTYKYQLLYAMDHPQHSTGGAWPMICYRVMLGMGVFQLVMAGLIALDNEFTAAVLVVPLIPFTVWYSHYYGRVFEPLMKYIALRSIEQDSDLNFADEENFADDSRPTGIVRRESTTLDEAREKGQRFVNPSLVIPLDKIWIDADPGEVEEESNGHSDPEPSLNRGETSQSIESLGDAHIWRTPQ
ncbi:hypothetical protein BJ878DRAFT_120110 [Calycina marina]|uniref:Uncharacterized protein n=1 Tax=Calycina marina TaxID=1763456 RepID=A0A9P8CDT6_9HELO|nr:hypothetical protein BJ878DRAFT_120110 [Calycina marina]